MEWTPYGKKRSQGRPKKRWANEIAQHAGIVWRRSSTERDHWARNEEEYA